MISSHKPVWTIVNECPACRSEDRSNVGQLAVEEYRFGEEIIPLPAGGIDLIRCNACGLVFKDTVPSTIFLSEVFDRQAGKVWTGDYDYSDEAWMIRELVGREKFDLLDVGPSSGGLLKALADSEGVRSALDVVEHPGLEKQLRGEFIQDLIETEDLDWSKEPYEVVGMFDILEHLYNPGQAFANLRDIVRPGGYVVAETGDVKSYWPEKFGAHRWWYACLFEHHVFWSRESLERIAEEYGFQISDFQNKRHKERGKVPLKRDVVTTAKTLTYSLNPDLHVKLARTLGKSGMQPWSPFTRDHFRAVLRRSFD